MGNLCECVRYLPQYADQYCQQQVACQDSYEDDPPGDPVLVSKTRFRIDHYWNLKGEGGWNAKLKEKEPLEINTLWWINQWVRQQSHIPVMINELLKTYMYTVYMDWSVLSTCAAVSLRTRLLMLDFTVMLALTSSSRALTARNSWETQRRTTRTNSISRI